MRLAAIAAPLGQAVALFAGGWLVAQLLGHAGFPLLRLGYAEEGGELGRARARRRRSRSASRSPAAGATAYAQLPPVVHLAAGVHQGPLVITRREVLVGEPGAVVRGGIVVRATGVTIKNVSVVGGENGIDGRRLRPDARSTASRSRARSSTASTSGGGVDSHPQLHGRHARQRVRPGNRHLVHAWATA